MAGRQDRFQFRISEGNNVSLFDEFAGHRRRLARWHPIIFCHLRHGLQHGQLAPVDFQLQPPSPFHESVAENVVNMAMCVEQPNGFQVVFTDEFVQLDAFVGLETTGVNDDALLRFIKNDVGIFLKWIEGKNDDGSGHVL